MLGSDLHLLIHNLVCIVSAIALCGAAFFTFLNGPKKEANIAWTLLLIFSNIFVISHAVGTNIIDPVISQHWFMWNLSIFFIGSCNVHAILCIIGKAREKRHLIIFFHASAVLLTLIFALFPDIFLLPSAPKMYFPNYYEPGILNFIRVAYLYGICVIYMLYILYKAWNTTTSIIERKQYAYMLATVMIGYAIGFIPNLLIYGIRIDPLWGMSFGALFVIPFAIGALRYNLFGIKVIAQQAFLYSLAVVGVGGLITLLNYSSYLLNSNFEQFPIWITGLASSILAVSIGVLVWRHLRETDVLKYEFISTVTHKFRTPLTHIKWASENLSAGSNLTTDDRTQLEYIRTANERLVELTNLLVNTSETEQSSYDYHLRRSDLSAIVSDVVSSLARQAEIKHMHFETHYEANLFAKMDEDRIRFVIQVFIENAIHYTPDNSIVIVRTERRGDNIICSVADAGIGIGTQEMPHLFSKFHRGDEARKADTEGMGIGLFMSKQIIDRHKGKIWAESAGIGKGSTFNFSLPTD